MSLVEKGLSLSRCKRLVEDVEVILFILSVLLVSLGLSRKDWDLRGWGEEHGLGRGW